MSKERFGKSKFYRWFRSCPGHAYTQSCLTLCDPWAVARQAPLSIGFVRQEYKSGLPFSPPEDRPDPEIEPASPVSPALQADSLPLGLSGKPLQARPK